MAVAPSARGALTSAFCRSSVRTPAVSPFMATSATGLFAAPSVDDTKNTTAQTTSPRTAACMWSLSSLLKTGESARTVAETLLAHVEQVHDAHQQIPRRNGLGREPEVPPALELTRGAAGQIVRHVVVQVLIGVADVAAVEHDGVIQERAVDILRAAQLLQEV